MAPNVIKFATKTFTESNAKTLARVKTTVIVTLKTARVIAETDGRETVAIKFVHLENLVPIALSLVNAITVECATDSRDIAIAKPDISVIFAS